MAAAAATPTRRGRCFLVAEYHENGLEEKQMDRHKCQYIGYKIMVFVVGVLN